MRTEVANDTMLNFFREIFVIINIITHRYLNLVILLISIIARTGYALIIFSSISQGQSYFYQLEGMIFAIFLSYFIYMGLNIYS